MTPFNEVTAHHIDFDQAVILRPRGHQFNEKRVGKRALIRALNLAAGNQAVNKIMLCGGKPPSPTSSHAASRFL